MGQRTYIPKMRISIIEETIAELQYYGKVDEANGIRHLFGDYLDEARIVDFQDKMKRSMDDWLTNKPSPWKEKLYSVG